MAAIAEGTTTHGPYPMTIIGQVKHVGSDVYVDSEWDMEFSLEVDEGNNFEVLKVLDEDGGEADWLSDKERDHLRDLALEDLNLKNGEAP